MGVGAGVDVSVNVGSAVVVGLGVGGEVAVSAGFAVDVAVIFGTALHAKERRRNQIVVTCTARYFVRKIPMLFMRRLLE